ncbi:mechanosensitive ion channel family protein [Microbacterium sp.]|uniref:mechanosensitive ion channel family protein n=1 Tax=Microbacterium sp. TaxID=51671 RepID=UPI003F985E8C
MPLIPFETPPEPTPVLDDLASFWGSVLKWLVEAGQNVLQVLLTVIVCIIVAFLLRLVIRRIVLRIVRSAKLKANVDDTQAFERSPLADMRLVQRTRTLGTILQNIVNVAVAIVALVLITNLLAPSLVGSLTLLTAAIGAGLGFGAQNIIKDVLNGLFIVAEDQMGIGDMVDMGLASGVVEYVAVRITHVRDVNGTLWYVRNGEITRIGNMSQGWARAIVDIGVPVDADVPQVEEALLAAASGLMKDAKWRTRIIERPEVWGLESITGDALIIRVVLKTRATAMDDVAQELRIRLKGAIEALDLTIPSMASVVPDGIEGARRVRGANPPTTRPNAVTGVPAPMRGIWRKKSPNPPPEPPDHPEPPAHPEPPEARK